jgi:sugar phosphate isomerase/epimerase
MKAGFHTVYLEDRSVEDAVRLVAAAGYDFIELNAERLPYAEPHVGPLAAEENTDVAARATREAGIGVSAVGAHCEMLSMDFDEAVEFGRECIEVASRVGAPVVHVLSGVAPEGMSQQQAFERCVRYADALVEIAADRGVKIAWEAVVGMAIATSEELARLCDAVGPRLWVNFDPSHFHLTDGDAVAAAQRLAPRTAHLHVKDAAGQAGTHSFPPLGEGEIDMPAVVEVLRSAGYDGVASVEWEAHAVGGFPREDHVALDGSRSYLRNNLRI